MAYFYLYDSDIPATVSASAEISSSDNDSAVVKVTASGYIPAGYWIYSTGVVVTITINGQPYTTTLFGNGSYYYGSDGAKTATFSVDVPKGTGAKNVAWSVAFKRAMDGYVYDTAHTATGTIAVGALPSYTVSYNANGGSGAPSAQTKWYGITLKLSTATPTRTGYSFLGWSTANDSSVEYAAGANYTANSGVTLYAVWKANTYTVSYNANGGSGAPGNQTKTYGVNLTLSSTKPTRTNYNFLGWATSASATSPQYAAGGTYSANSGVTLYAVWQLAYTKPRINGLSVERCDADGNALEEGTYARVSFAWATDRAVSSITLYWTSANANSGSWAISASGTSGTVNEIFGGGDYLYFDSDVTYNITVTVADSGGSTPASTTLSSIKYTIDFLEGGNGVAIGRAAELEDRFDVAFESVFRKPIDPQGGIYIPDYRNEELTPSKFGNHNVRAFFHKANLGRWKTILDIHGWTEDYDTTQIAFPADQLGLDRNIAYRCGARDSGWSPWYTLLDNVNFSGYIDALGGFKFNHTFVGLYNSWTDAHNNQNRKGWIGHDGRTDLTMTNEASGHIYLSAGGKLVMLHSTYFSSGVNDQHYLGLSSYKWKAVYAITGTIQTSDRNYKTDIKPIEQKYDDLFDKLQPVTFKLAGGEHDRVHIGFIAQDVKAAMDELNIDVTEFAAYCRDKKIERVEVEDPETGEKSTQEVEVLDDNGDPVYMYALRYTEFIALNTFKIQKLQNEVSELKDENEKLKARLKKIEAMLGIE